MTGLALGVAHHSATLGGGIAGAVVVLVLIGLMAGIPAVIALRSDDD